MAAWAGAGPALLGVRLEFLIFAAILAGIAAFHQRSLQVAASGLAVLVVFIIAFYLLCWYLIQRGRGLRS